MKIGEYNELRIARFVDFGAYLVDEDGVEILIPSKYIPDNAVVGDMIKVFVYNDSSDRPIATTRTPKAVVGQMALLRVVSVNDIGAFLDWGLEKDLLVPFREQRARMRKGGEYLVYIYRDDASRRIVASAKYEKFIDNAYPDFKPHQQVEALIVAHTNLGYRVVVDNKFTGLIYENDIFNNIEIGQTVTAYVKKVRPDGKLDLTTRARQSERAVDVASKILARLRQKGGSDEIGDFSSPEYIRSSFNCSKKDFKIAIGNLLKSGKVAKTDHGLKLLNP